MARAWDRGKGREAFEDDTQDDDFRIFDEMRSGLSPSARSLPYREKEVPIGI
jgi:hypothetical protein